MKTQTLLLAGAAALLLLPRRQAVGVAPVNGQVRQDYPNPSAIAANFAGRVLESLRIGFVSTPSAAATANSKTVEDARAAVRAGDTYYGLGANAWYAGNAEAAREAVRAGDTYYTSQAQIWTLDPAYAATGGAGFLSDEVAAALY